jgi:hypothetical protein
LNAFQLLEKFSHKTTSSNSEVNEFGQEHGWFGTDGSLLGASELNFLVYPIKV